jgi:hypothetical protein
LISNLFVLYSQSAFDDILTALGKVFSALFLRAPGLRQFLETGQHGRLYLRKEGVRMTSHPIPDKNYIVGIN